MYNKTMRNLNMGVTMNQDKVKDKLQDDLKMVCYDHWFPFQGKFSYCGVPHKENDCHQPMEKPSKFCPYCGLLVCPNCIEIESKLGK